MKKIKTIDKYGTYTSCQKTWYDVFSITLRDSIHLFKTIFLILIKI